MSEHLNTRSKMAQFNMRRAQIGDAPVLAKVHVASWQEAYRGVVPDSFLQRFTYSMREEAFRRALEANSEETYLLEDKDGAVGILTSGQAAIPTWIRHAPGRSGASTSRQPAGGAGLEPCR